MFFLGSVLSAGRFVNRTTCVRSSDSDQRRKGGYENSRRVGSSVLILLPGAREYFINSFFFVCATDYAIRFNILRTKDRVSQQLAVTICSLIS